MDSIFLLGALLIQARKATDDYCTEIWIILVTVGSFVTHVARFARNWTTVYIAASRCAAIIKPLHSINRRSINRTKKWCVAILIVSVPLSIDSLVLPYEWSIFCSAETNVTGNYNVR